MEHVPVHFVSDAIPDQTGYTLRTHKLVCAQRHVGMDPAVVVQPCNRLYQCDQVWANGVGVRYIGKIPYFRLSEPRPLRRWGIILSQRLRSMRVRGSVRFGLRFDMPEKPWDRFATGLGGVLSRASIIHAHTPHYTARHAFKIAQGLGVPCVYEVRGFWDLTAATDGCRTIGEETLEEWRDADTRVAHQADAVITLGKAMKEELVTRGVNAEKIHVVENGVDSGEFTPSDYKDRQLLRKHGLQGRFVIGYVTSIRRLEGIEVLLRSLRQLLDIGIPASVLLVGSGRELQMLGKIADTLGVGEQARFVGAVPHTEVHKYYSLMDVFVVPRIDAPVCRIVTPLKPLEAMALGKPVVVSDLPALRELVEPGSTGMSFEADNPADLTRLLRQLYRKPSFRSELGYRAREWVERERSWASLAAKTRAVYERLLTDRKRCCEAAE